jgi:hypothetical protein
VAFSVVLPKTAATGLVISVTVTQIITGNTAANVTFGDTSEFSNDITAI